VIDLLFNVRRGLLGEDKPSLRGASAPRQSRKETLDCFAAARNDGTARAFAAAFFHPPYKAFPSEQLSAKHINDTILQSLLFYFVSIRESCFIWSRPP
jgi:hypothetical protein